MEQRAPPGWRPEPPYAEESLWTQPPEWQREARKAGPRTSGRERPHSRRDRPFSAGSSHSSYSSASEQHMPPERRGQRRGRGVPRFKTGMGHCEGREDLRKWVGGNSSASMHRQDKLQSASTISKLRSVLHLQERSDRGSSRGLTQQPGSTSVKRGSYFGASAARSLSPLEVRRVRSGRPLYR